MISMNTNKPKWSLVPEPIEWCRNANDILSAAPDPENQFHTGLTGGVLFRGDSSKDVDVIIYPRKKFSGFDPIKHVGSVRERLVGAGLISATAWGVRDHSDYGDDKLVYKTETPDGRRIDLFFLA